MDNWPMRENSDSPVGVNGFVDNMQFLWKLQSLIPANEGDASQSFADLNAANSTTDLPDENDDLVDKLFRESLAMQNMQDSEVTDMNGHNQQQQEQPPTQSKQGQENALHMLLSSPPDPIQMDLNPTTETVNDTTPIMSRKRSRSPVSTNEYPFTQQQVPDISQPVPHPQQSMQVQTPVRTPGSTEPLAHPQQNHYRQQQPTEVYSPYNQPKVSTNYTPISPMQHHTPIMQLSSSTTPTADTVSAKEIKTTPTIAPAVTAAVTSNHKQKQPERTYNNGSVNASPVSTSYQQLSVNSLSPRTIMNHTSPGPSYQHNVSAARPVTNTMTPFGLPASGAASVNPMVSHSPPQPPTVAAKPVAQSFYSQQHHHQQQQPPPQPQKQPSQQAQRPMQQQQVKHEQPFQQQQQQQNPSQTTQLPQRQLPQSSHHTILQSSHQPTQSVIHQPLSQPSQQPSQPPSHQPPRQPTQQPTYQPTHQTLNPSTQQSQQQSAHHGAHQAAQQPTHQTPQQGALQPRPQPFQQHPQQYHQQYPQQKQPSQQPCQQPFQPAVQPLVQQTSQLPEQKPSQPLESPAAQIRQRPLVPPQPLIPPRPQLRLHLKRQDLFEIANFDENKDPMKPDLDVTNLRRLTVATLRSLGVSVSFDELPSVEIENASPTDSHQVLPAAAMQLITTMVLGTSGDKDVSQTLGSQISNGDLVALQRMIVAGLRSKNIVIHTVLTEQQGIKEEPNENHVPRAAKPDDTIIDLTNVRYDPPHNVTRLFLRLYRFIINMLLSTPDCWPFIQPVPETAFLYHQEIKNPMDLQTIEENVWRGKYTKFARFERDMQLIWKNARTFHRNTGTIPKHADNLQKLFVRIVMDIKKQIRPKQQPSSSHDFKFDPTYTLPEESDFSYPPIDQVFSEQSTVYAISALSPFEPKGRKPKGLTNEKLLYLQLNGPFFQAVERMKSDLDGNHSIVPRFYIAKNRTLLRQIRSQGVLAIFYNTKTTRIRSSKMLNIETDMILAYPASDLFDIDQINECTDDFAPKAWIHLRPLRVVNRITFEVNEPIERDYFKRMFATSKMAIDDKNAHHNSTTKKLLRKVVRQILGLPELNSKEQEDATALLSKSTGAAMKKEAKEDGHRSMLQQRMLKTKEEEAMEVDRGSDDEKFTPKSAAVSPEKMEIDVKAEITNKSNAERLGKKEIDHEIWKKLFDECQKKGIEIKNITSHGNINWNSPNSEGFFKRVYFFDNIVVQAFRQMTMYQRITEVACLMKLRNLPHMAQMKEVLFNDNGDVAGLSMERYQTTLKQYAHAHSHHRLTAYQKYDVIQQMLVCMKTIHEAGLAHRDLSEVNIMVDVVQGQHLEDGTEKVCLYLIDFGKAVFCRAEDVRDWFVDVPRAEWEYDGDVVPESREELDAWCESLPWVKGKPDHGYRMYRSIQTLPKTRSDNQVLPWLIHPQAEDMYSIGVMIWKVFTDTEPWRGILDTDLQGLRYVAEDDYRIQRALEGEVHGELSRQLLLKCLKTRPQDRETAKDLLEWISQQHVREGLIGEWKMYSSDTRASRRAKTYYGFEDEEEEKKKPPRKRNNTGGSKPRGRPPKIVKEAQAQTQAQTQAQAPPQVPPQAPNQIQPQQPQPQSQAQAQAQAELQQASQPQLMNNNYNYF